MSFSVLLLALGACDSSKQAEKTTPDQSKPQQTLSAGRDVGYEFDSFEQLIANSELVIYGEVTNAVKGHPIGDLQDPRPLVVRDVTVRVDQVFYGRDPGPSVIVDQEGYSGDMSFELAEQPWVYAGDEVVFFLVDTDSRPAGHYTITAPGGQIVIVDGIAKTPAEDPIAMQMDGKSWPQVKDQIVKAVVSARQNPLPPLPGGPSK